MNISKKGVAAIVSAIVLVLVVFGFISQEQGERIEDAADEVIETTCDVITDGDGVECVE